MTGASVCLVRDNGEFETLYEYIDSPERLTSWHSWRCIFTVTKD